MAKKKVVAKEGQLPDPFEMMKAIDDSVEILEDSVFSNIKEWVSTGNYMLNACISGSLFGGLPSSKVCTLVGDPGTGKTYLACNMAREAQNAGYNILWLDSEGAMDKQFAVRLGLDANKVMIKQVNTISETSQLIANLCQSLDEMREQYGNAHKFMIVLDSLGNLTSDKEKTDTIEGNDKRDMTRAQNIRAMFRVNATPIARNGIIFLVIAHQYASTNMYSSLPEVGGGGGIKYNSSVTIYLTTSKLQNKSVEEAAAKTVNSEAMVKTGVLVTARPLKSRFTIPRKVQFIISYAGKNNKFVGMESYLTWENSHVCRGTILTKSEYDKLGGESNKSLHSWDYNGTTMYCQQKDTARGIVVGHLGKTVGLTDIWSDEVFTDEFLHHIDETVIKKSFMLPTVSDLSEIENLLDGNDDEIDLDNIDGNE